MCAMHLHMCMGVESSPNKVKGKVLCDRKESNNLHQFLKYCNSFIMNC